MPTERERVRRLTLNLSADLYAEIVELARVTHLNVAPCARMLIAEALARRARYKKHPAPPPPPGVSRPRSKPRRR